MEEDKEKYYKFIDNCKKEYEKSKKKCSICNNKWPCNYHNTEKVYGLRKVK